MEAHTPSSALVPVIDGVVGFRLVHNFGAAWGSFSGMVIVLVIVSIVLCAIILAYMIYVAKEASVLETVGLALIFAGGLGNMIDRLVRGYVVDFVEPLFIDFPNFNIADAGITCGIICVLTYPHPYEALKALTRTNQAITEGAIKEFIVP